MPSDTAVHEATGRGWAEWFDLLDAAGAETWDHKQTVVYLQREHPDVSGWWHQSITVEYERARGKRVTGQTADAGFQVGVQRSVSATPAVLWELITSRPDLWLGEGASIAFTEGEQYEVPAGAGASGARGEIRVVKPGTRLRMTWQPEGWTAPATVQLTLSESGPTKTALHAHLEKLPDAEAREAMRVRWRQALERIAAATS